MAWGPYDLTGKAAIVTGGARGIGLACCARLREAGAHVLVADRRGDATIDAARELAKIEGPGELEPMTVDVTDPEQVEDMAARCVELFGSLDVLVNNAGIFPAMPIVDMTPEFIHRVLRVNIEGTVMATRAAALHMIKAGAGGSIINLASRDAFQPYSEGLSVYGASKGAIVTFTKHAALEFAKHQIRVNAVAPGSVSTEGVERAFSGLSDDQRRDIAAEMLARQPLGRMSVPDDIATVVAFLASPAAGFVTGDTILADGGALLL
jgi:2-deoxy-D-gluconate 3-dehydrogenase